MVTNNTSDVVEYTIHSTIVCLSFFSYIPFTLCIYVRSKSKKNKKTHQQLSSDVTLRLPPGESHPTIPDIKQSNHLTMGPFSDRKRISRPLRQSAPPMPLILTENSMHPLLQVASDPNATFTFHSLETNGVRYSEP